MKNKQNSEQKKEIQVGGQAVIEGVMMRGPKYLATAVRRKDKSIEIKKQKFDSKTKQNKFFGLPIIRGFVSLVEMMIIGIGTLSFSASRAELDWEDKDKEKKKKKSESREKTEEIFSYIFAFGLAFLLFAFLPYRIAEWLNLGKQNIYFNLFAGAIRIIFFVLYVWLISLMKDVKRIFEYHGAEHKSVFAYESDTDLSLESIQKFGTQHPRCGTSFMFFVLLISILVFSIVDTLVAYFWKTPTYIVRLAYHILMIPFISGISYEVLKLSGKNIKHPLVKLMTAPGLALQKITTQPPDNEQVEVAVIAMKCALEMDISEYENVTFIEENK
ncbi:MAG: DUF1385 domain-containing protein [Candidatus Cloacimonetes bacterium]|nr:DUF1385 domain-containing protein [Candidatus Cloacimonadota bacterium]MCF7813866.1 DUF1385 domain-containing protein [Candidatus Cloacimonadota bacterium]MCF7869454.1 DUF1385 domain-containing protein [Candidatus Cloacimonadota bacterium]MCF7883978.1 DUF1385 domain-containing protein [Candidatus Cloacimonadota bacterium]